MHPVRCLVLSFALLCGGAAHGQDSGSMSDPRTLFAAACASGQARLPRSKFDDVAYAVMPAGARKAFALSAKVPAAKPAPVAPFGDLEVPNRVLVLMPARELYLLLPAAGAPGAAAEACSVVWQGANFAEAAAAVTEYRSSGPAVEAPALPAGASYTAFTGTAGTRVIGAELDQWTALTIVPDATSKEQKTP